MQYRCSLLGAAHEAIWCASTQATENTCAASHCSSVCWPCCVFQVQRSWGLTHPVINQLPFSTCFNVGAGLSHFTAGVTSHTSSSAASARHGDTTPATAAAAAGSVAGAGAGGVAAEQGPWYNLLATDTLPCARDPVSQQVGR